MSTVYSKPLTITSFPSELLSRIFMMCKDRDIRSLTQLSHVCGFFRQVSINHHALWSNIQVETKPGALKLAKLWLERAANMPLALTIRYRHLGDEIILAPWLTRNLVEKLVKKMTLLHLARSQINNGLLGFLVRLPIQTMESFCILGLEDIEVHIRTIADILHRNENLSSLSLSGAACLHDPHSLAGIGDRLTHLSFGEWSHVDYNFPLHLNAILELLIHCTRLVSLECYAAADDSGDEDEDDIEVDGRIHAVYLSNLISLTIGDGPETCLLLSYLRAPALHSIRLTRGVALDGSETEVDVSQSRNIEETSYSMLFTQCMQAFQINNGSIISEFIWDRTVAPFGILQSCASYLTNVERLEFLEVNNVALGFLGLGQNNRLYASLQCIRMYKCSVNEDWWQTIVYLYNSIRSSTYCLPKIERSHCSGASNISIYDTNWAG